MPRYKPLSDDMVKIIMKKHQKGCSVEEIAEVLEITKQRVTGTINRNKGSSLDEGVKEVIVRVAYQEPGAPMAYIAEVAQEMCCGEDPDLKLTAAMVDQVLKETGWKEALKHRAKHLDDYLDDIEGM